MRSPTAPRPELRLGVVTTSYPRWPGDPAGGFVADHVRWMVEQGHRVEVVAAGGAAQPRVETSEDGVRVWRVPAPAGLFYAGGAPEALADHACGAGFRAAVFSLALTAEVVRRSSAWQGIIAHWLVPSAVAAALASRGRPVLAIAHSGDVHLLCRTRLATPVAALLRAANAEMVFVTADLRARLARAVHPGLRARIEGARVCAMGIDVARFRRIADAAGSPRDQLETVLFLGRLVPVKGVHAAIDAAARWRCGARLVIAGAGPDEERLRAHAAAATDARIEFVGEAHGAARDRLLANADVLLVPSVRVEGRRTEGMPVAVLEAMAARVPVIASDVGGLAELPRASVTRVAPGDPVALANAVDWMATDASARARQVRAAEGFVETRDWSVVGRIFAVNLQ